MAIWGAMAAVGAAVGPIVGGWVIDTFSWHAAFLMNIPVMLLLLVLGPLLLPESRNPGLHRIDLFSVLLSLLGMVGVVYAIKTLTGGKDLVLGFAALILGVVAIVLFVRRQLRLETPLLDVRLFKVPYFRGAVVADLLSIFAMVGALVALIQHLQLVLGLSPLESAMWLIPHAVLAATAGFVATALVKRILPAFVITAGLLIAAVGFSLTLLGGVLVAWYTRAVTSATEALDLTAGLAERASSTMAEALLVASEVGGGVATSLLAAARGAFTEAIVVAGIAGAGIMVLAAVWALTTLRGAAANQDLAAEHEQEHAH